MEYINATVENVKATEDVLQRLDGLAYLGCSEMNEPINEGGERNKFLLFSLFFPIFVLHIFACFKD